MNDDPSQSSLLRQVEASLTHANSQISRLKRANGLLIATTITTGALSTALAGISAVGGVALIGSGEPGWRTGDGAA